MKYNDKFCAFCAFCQKETEGSIVHATFGVTICKACAKAAKAQVTAGDGSGPFEVLDGGAGKGEGAGA